MSKVTTIHPRLQHLGMTTTNIDAMLAWYRDVLGMSLVHRTASATGPHDAAQILKAAWVTNDEANHRLAFVELPGLSTPVHSDPRNPDTFCASQVALPP
jgi:catechol 2,3-dioxygenase